MVALRLIRVLAVTAGSVGGLSGATYGLLSEQSRRARAVIGTPLGLPFNADGVYLPAGDGPLFHTNPLAAGALHFAMFGDSSAAGLGAQSPRELPGVLLAAGLAEETAAPVRLTTHAVCGATTRELPAQVDAALLDPPGLALIVVGGNDVTARIAAGTSARLLGEQVSRLRDAGTTVVVGTCPDLGVIRPIPQPLRALVHRWSLALAAAQREAVYRAGGHPVNFAELVSAEFAVRPELFSMDRFHPSGAGYELASSVLLAPLLHAYSRGVAARA